MKLSTGRALLVVGLSLLAVVVVNWFWFRQFDEFMVLLCVTYLIGMVAAYWIYSVIKRRWSYRGAAYAGAMIAFVAVCCASAELVRLLYMEERSETYLWVFSYGLVAIVSWLLLDLLLRGRLERSNLWVKPVLAVLAIGCVAGAGWYAYSVPINRVKNPSPKDCALMVQALKDFSPEGFEQGIRLNSQAQCDWVSLGVSENSLRKSEPKTIEGLWDFDPWFSVDKPSYSLFRNRAFIDVGGEWISLGGGGQRCQYDHTRKGWKKTNCEGTWIS